MIAHWTKADCDACEWQLLAEMHALAVDTWNRLNNPKAARGKP